MHAKERLTLALPKGRLLDGALFVKRFAYEEGASYPDLGCNNDVFTAGSFIELESLSKLVRLPFEFGAQLLEARLKVGGLLLGGARARLKLFDVSGLEARLVNRLVFAARRDFAVRVEATAVVDANPCGRLVRVQLLRPILVSRLLLCHASPSSPPVEKFHFVNRKS